MSTTHVDLQFSARATNREATRIGKADPADTVELTITIRGKQPLTEPWPMAAPMAIDQIEDKFGAEPADMEKAMSAFREMGLEIAGYSAGARTIELRGTVAQVEKTFSVDLGMYDSPSQPRFRGREGVLQIPAQLDGIVTGVFGLDERSVARRRATRLIEQIDQHASKALDPQASSDLEQRYNFPSGKARDQRIGILEFGGGYWPSDLRMYCDQVSRTAMPKVNAIPVGKESLSLQDIQAIADPQQRAMEFDASIEVNMDIQVVAGLCPEAEIMVYFAPFTQSGWINALKKAIHDPNGPKVISVSWGVPEDVGLFSTAARNEINQTLQVAALAGITVCVSSGDDGAGDAANDGLAHVDFPASSPYVLSVGGTMVGLSGETGWWESPGARTKHGGGSSGGGRSTIFATPDWQKAPVVSLRTYKTEGRCIPDVAALSRPPMYALIFGGQLQPNGGTSAAAPLWAALLARISANLAGRSRIGFLTPRLYTTGPTGQTLGEFAMTDVTIGHNDVIASAGMDAVTGYQARIGYDAITGWGVPDGVALQKALALR